MNRESQTETRPQDKRDGNFLTAAGLAQLIERSTAEREVAGSIPGAGPLLRVLKWLRNEGTAFVLRAAGPSRGSDDHVKWRSRFL